MDELAVRTYRENLYAQLDQLVVPRGDRRKLRGSDEGKVTGVKADDDPFPLIVREFDGFEAAVHKGVGLEIRGRITDLYSHFNLPGFEVSSGKASISVTTCSPFRTREIRCDLFHG
jgi:hypothetical protein